MELEYTPFANRCQQCNPAVQPPKVEKPAILGNSETIQRLSAISSEFPR